MKKILFLGILGYGIYYVYQNTTASAKTAAVTPTRKPVNITAATANIAATKTAIPISIAAQPVATPKLELPTIVGVQLKIGSPIEYKATIKMAFFHTQATIGATIQGMKDANTLMVQVVSAKLGDAVIPTPAELLTGLQECPISAITKVS